MGDTPATVAAEGQNMPKRRFHNPTKEPIYRGPKRTMQARMPKKVADDIERAAEKIGKGITGFLIISAGEIAKIIIEIHKKHPELEANDLERKAFAALRLQREAYSSK